MNFFTTNLQSGFYKLRLSATLYSVNAARASLTFQEDGEGQQYKILQGIFKGEEVHSNTIDVLVSNTRDSEDIRIVSVITSNLIYQLPDTFSLAIEIDAFESMGYTGNFENTGYKLVGVTVVNPSVSTSNS